MPTPEKKTRADLAQTRTGTLSNRVSMMSVGALEHALLKKYPAEDAQDWDRTGLLVGDPAAIVSNVAVCLDPTVKAIEEARGLGANVLITHHPVYLDAPTIFMPSDSPLQSSGCGVWAAIENKVALMCFHTALDVSQDGAKLLPGMLRLKFEGIVDPIDESGKKGYGQLCSLSSQDKGMSLGQLAARCTSVFSRHPRVWGDFNRSLSRIVTCTGSSGDLVKKCIAAHVDVLVAGEVRYHDALDASQAGLAIIDLGHDTSELPLLAALVASVEDTGIASERITIIEQNNNWSSPESIRV